MKRCIWIINLIILTIIVSSCSSSSTQNRFSKEIAFPKETKTRATDYLGCFGDMLTTYRRDGHDVDLLRLAIVSVKDSTNVSTVSSQLPSEIPSDFTDMSLSIASRIGGPIRVVHIPAPQELFDAARYGSIPGKKPPFLDKFKSTHYRGDTLQIYGALTEYDRITKSRQSEVDASIEAGGGSGITNLEISASGIVNVARMTMDFRVVYAAVGDVVNNSSSSNTVTVYQRGVDRSFGLSIDGNSIGYSTSRSVVDARHKAIRLLIEWGLIESLGRYTLIPYWKCLPSSANRNMLGFKDLVSDDSFYNFQSFNRNNKVQSLKRKSELVDMRDKLLMNAVLSDFENAEYLKNATRHLIKRSERNTTLIQRKRITVPVPAPKSADSKTDGTTVNVEKIIETKSVIEGKSSLRRKILQLYRRDKKYSKLSEDALLNQLRGLFIKSRILNAKDSTKSANMYLAMWLNAPVIKNARWRK